jgi:FtsZ-binding cell division protein ZapB
VVVKSTKQEVYKELKAVNKTAERKIKELNEKLAKRNKELSSTRSESRSLRKKNKALKESRDSWKGKAMERREDVNRLKKKVLYYQNKQKSKWHQYTDALIVLVVLLRVKVGCSYKKIRHILEIYMYYFGDTLGGTHRLPTDRTMQNWVSKWGYYHLQTVDTKPFSEEVCLIIDESISVGNESLLLCLICPSDNPKEEALSYEDVAVLGMKGDKSWTGDKIEEFVRSLLAEKGYTVSYVVSDEGPSIKKGVRQLETPHLFDISHAIATCLKKTFEKKEAYKAFLKDVRSYQSKLSNGKNSYLRPPKQRSKARFMNQEKLVFWAMQLYKKWSCLEAEQKEIFKNMPNHKAIVEQLNDCLKIAKTISNPLKIKGVTEETISEALKFLEKNEKNEKKGYCIHFLDYLKPYLKKYENFINQERYKGKRVTVCSDVIESFFGTYKSKQSNNYFNGVTEVTLELPLLGLSQEALCLNPRFILEEVKTTDFKDWIDTHSTDNQNIKRVKFFKN